MTLDVDFGEIILDDKNDKFFGKLGVKVNKRLWY